MITINEALIAHEKWLKTPTWFSRVNWKNILLHRENFSGANLKWVDFTEAYLSWANLSKANLFGADLTEANLTEANLSGADLTGAILFKVNLMGANLTGADLTAAVLAKAILIRTNLTGAKLPEPKVKLPPKGESHIGYKKVRGNWILTLRIEEDSDRVCPLNGMDGQCRASKVTVLSAEDMHGNPAPESMVFSSLFNSNFRYRVGETKVELNYDGSMTEYMAAGIHYFTNKKMAVNYV